MPRTHRCVGAAQEWLPSPLGPHLPPSTTHMTPVSWAQRRGHRQVIGFHCFTEVGDSEFGATVKVQCTDKRGNVITAGTDWSVE